MASELDNKSLEQAFGGRPDIQDAIKAAAGMDPRLPFHGPLVCFRLDEVIPKPSRIAH